MRQGISAFVSLITKLLPFSNYSVYVARLCLSPLIFSPQHLLRVSQFLFFPNHESLLVLLPSHLSFLPLLPHSILRTCPIQQAYGFLTAHAQQPAVWLRSLARERLSCECFDQLRRGSAAVCSCQAVGGPYVARYKRFESSDPYPL